MLFNSLTFLIFFIIVFTLHRLIPGWNGKKLLLLAASYLFYTAWNPPYVFILLFSTSMDWWLARQIWKSNDPRKRKMLLVLSLACNLGLLSFFKYSGFLLSNTRLLLSTVGVHYTPPALDIVLPIGISFYTFASLSYTIDVYRHELKGDSPYLDYALFVSFFPHLIAGPIVRARQLLPQIKEPRQVSRDQLGWGLVLVCIGLFTKTVMADSVFAPVVDAAYGNAHPAMLESWAAVFGFSGQIYCDFSGYSLCAIGLALCFGFEFPDNFRYPYAARGFSDFWRRWHITLSTWLRDYLYIPLGGNRQGEVRTYVNLMLTMLIGGLWHGASWMFVLWGGLHGLYLAVERWIRGPHPQAALTKSGDAAITLLTFLLVTLTWIPFRAKDAHTAAAFIAGLLRFKASLPQETTPLVLCFFGILLLICWQFMNRDISLEERFNRLGTNTQMVVIGGCLIAMFLYSGGDERAFIYFQF
ncbi:MAG: MBOAT family O-acyltransferase [Gammaproteobacteria bacterium]